MDVYTAGDMAAISAPDFENAIKSVKFNLEAPVEKAAKAISVFSAIAKYLDVAAKFIF